MRSQDMITIGINSLERRSRQSTNLEANLFLFYWFNPGTARAVTSVGTVGNHAR
jgi:hypothetical protein